MSTTDRAVWATSRKREADAEERDWQLAEADRAGAAVLRSHRRLADGFGTKMGGGPCNTPPATRHGHESTGGEDTLHLSLQVSWGIGFASLFGRLDEAKKSAQENAKDACQGSAIGLGGEVGIVARTGAAPDQDGGPVYRWRISADGCSLCIARQNEPVGEMANVLVSMGSLFLMSHGIWAGFERVQGWIEHLGGTILRTTVGRVDPCVDLAGISVEEFCTPFGRGCWISRARRRSTHGELTAAGTQYRQHGFGRRSTGFDIGAKQIKLRVYDKLHEVKQSGDEAKRAALIRWRWGGKEPEHATRVEFQIRRQALKEWGIDTPDDWVRKRAHVVAYLTGQVSAPPKREREEGKRPRLKPLKPADTGGWFRMTDREPDAKNRNQSRAQTLDVWATVRDFFAAWTGRKPPTNRQKIDRGDATALLKQALGCIKSAASRIGYAVSGADDALGFAVDRLAALLMDAGPPDPDIPPEAWEEARDAHIASTWGGRLMCYQAAHTT